MIGISEDEIQELVEARIDAKKKKDYRQADQIRKELQGLGVILEDTKEGTTWRRKI